MYRHDLCDAGLAIQNSNRLAAPDRAEILAQTRLEIGDSHSLHDHIMTINGHFRNRARQMQRRAESRISKSAGSSNADDGAGHPPRELGHLFKNTKDETWRRGPCGVLELAAGLRVFPSVRVVYPKIPLGIRESV